jgi:hypothetical protein
VCAKGIERTTLIYSLIDQTQARPIGGPEMKIVRDDHWGSMTRRLVSFAAAAVVAAIPAGVMAAPALATTINCVYTGPVVGHPGMQYVCYAIHDDGSREAFYAPGPAANP